MEAARGAVEKLQPAEGGAQKAVPQWGPHGEAIELCHPVHDQLFKGGMPHQPSFGLPW